MPSPLLMQNCLWRIHNYSTRYLLYESCCRQSHAQNASARPTPRSLSRSRACSLSLALSLSLSCSLSLSRSLSLALSISLSRSPSSSHSHPLRLLSYQKHVTYARPVMALKPPQPKKMKICENIDLSTLQMVSSQSRTVEQYC